MQRKTYIYTKEDRMATVETVGTGTGTRLGLLAGQQ